ncbi:MAG: sodium-independent anion transporter [Acidimicrobiales bacterium]
MSTTEGAVQLPGVLVVLFAAPLWYANAVHFRAQIDGALARAAEKPSLVVLDTLGMSDIDYTGSRALRRVLDELTRDGIEVAVSRAGSHLRQGLVRSGLFERIGAAHFYPSVDKAITALGSKSGDR